MTKSHAASNRCAIANGSLRLFADAGLFTGYTAIGTYYPMFQKLFALQDRSDSPFKICAVWMLEGANHNDSAVMNEHILKSHFANECEWKGSFLISRS